MNIKQLIKKDYDRKIAGLTLRNNYGTTFFIELKAVFVIIILSLFAFSLSCANIDDTSTTDQTATLTLGTAETVTLASVSETKTYKISLTENKVYEHVITNAPIGTLTIKVDNGSGETFNWTWVQSGSTATRGNIFTITSGKSGDYTVTIGASSSIESTAFTFTISDSSDIQEPNDSDTTATAATTGTTYTAKIFGTGDIDTYVYSSLSGSRTYTFTNLPLGTFKVDIYNNSGCNYNYTWIQSATNTTRAATFTACSGSNYIKLYSSAGDNSTNSYTLKVQ